MITPLNYIGSSSYMALIFFFSQTLLFYYTYMEYSYIACESRNRSRCADKGLIIVCVCVSDTSNIKVNCHTRQYNCFICVYMCCCNSRIISVIRHPMYVSIVYYNVIVKCHHHNDNAC